MDRDSPGPPHRVPSSRPRLIEMDAPVDPDHVPARFPHLAKHRRGARAKMNHRNAFSLQSLKNQLDVRQDIFGIIADRETAHPTIEQLNRLRTGLDLPTEIAGDDPRKLVHELMPGFRLAIHQLFGKEIIARTSALDCITRESEGRAGKSDQRHPASSGHVEPAGWLRRHTRVRPHRSLSADRHPPGHAPGYGSPAPRLQQTPN